MTEQLLVNDWHKINFFQPISKQSIHNRGPYPESAEGKTSLRVKGPAIHAVTTRNGTTFTPEELAKSAQTLIGKPILKDHDNSVDSIVGQVTDAYYDAESSAVMYEGVVIDEKMATLIEEGYLMSVSIGAMVGDYEDMYNEDGEVTQTIVKEISFVEISLVAVPADPNAGVAKAFMESYKGYKESHSTSHAEVDDIMAEEIKTEQAPDFSEQLETITSMVSEALGKFEASTAELNERINTLSEKVEASLSEESPEVAAEEPVAEEPVAEESTEESVDETVSEIVTEQSVENNDNAFTVRRAGGAYEMSGDYSSFGAVRLTRNI